MGVRSCDPRRLALALEGLAGVALLEEDGYAAAWLLSAAGTFRQSPGQATGWAFTVGARADVDRILAGAIEAIGADAAAAAVAAGAADPLGAIESVMNGATLVSSASS